MAVRYYARRMGGRPVALYRIVDDAVGLTGAFLGRRGWVEDPDALRFELAGEVDADEVSADEARLIAAALGVDPEM